MPAEEEVEEEGDGRQGAGAEGRRVEGLGGRVRGEVVVRVRETSPMPGCTPVPSAVRGCPTVLP